MQKDMHYYGTLALAIAAGIPQEDAKVIAYASQFVDDSTSHDSNEHEDHGLLYAIGTSHHPLQSFVDKMKTPIVEGTKEQRKIWIPFHYLPGGKGNILSEKLLCVKNSDIAHEMLENNLEVSLKKPYGLELMGITAHVYMDTFSHYGFSGITSSFNVVKNETIQFSNKPDVGIQIKGRSLGKLMGKIIEISIEKFANFTEKHFVGPGAQAASKLGHAGLSQYPDRPYLQYKFNFERPRPDDGIESKRDNKADYLEGCKCLHDFFSKFARSKYSNIVNYQNFEEIEETIKTIIKREDEIEGRIQAWRDSGLIGDCEVYNPEIWEQDKIMFHNYGRSEEGIYTNVYRFHQAATFHRYYILKDLLPEHNIAVY